MKNLFSFKPKPEGTLLGNMIRAALTANNKERMKETFRISEASSGSIVQTMQGLRQIDQIEEMKDMYLVTFRPDGATIFEYRKDFVFTGYK